MPQGQYPGNPNSYPANIALPDGSDTLTASEFDVGFENLADRTAFLSKRGRGLPGQNWEWANLLPTLTTAPTLVLQPLVGFGASTTAPPEVNAAGFFILAAGDGYVFPLTNISQGALLTQIDITISGTATGSEVLSVWKTELNSLGTSVFQIGSNVTIASGAHSNTTFSVTGLTESIDKTTYSYFVIFANSTNSLQMSPVRARVTSVVATNTPVPITFTSGQPVWDSTYGQWLISAIDASLLSYIARSFDGVNWDALGGVNPAYYKFTAAAAEAGSPIVRPSDGLVSVLGQTGASAYSQAAQTWANSSFSGPVASPPYGVYFNGLFVMLPGNQQPWTCADGLSYTQSGGSGWPAGYQPNPYAICVSTASPPEVFAFSGALTPTTFAYTGNGLVWATMPLSSNVGEQVVGACWDNAFFVQNGGATGGLCWLLSNGSTSRLFINGVLAGTIPHPCIGLASNNGELLTIAQFGRNRDNGGNLYNTYRGVQCVDGLATGSNSASFQLTQLEFPNYQIEASVTTGNINGLGLAASGGEFLLFVSVSSSGLAGINIAHSNVAGQIPGVPF